MLLHVEQFYLLLVEFLLLRINTKYNDHFQFGAYWRIDYGTNLRYVVSASLMTSPKLCCINLAVQKRTKQFCRSVVYQNIMKTDRMWTF